MKIKRNEEPRVFTPTGVTFTFESLNEVLALHAVFNTTSICRFLEDKGINPEAVRQDLSRIFYLSPSNTENAYQDLIKRIRST